MRQATIKSPGGLENLVVANAAEPPQPGAGEVRVRLRASSLNFHDYLVACGRIPTDDGRNPMSDGAGTVEAVGEDVAEFAPAATWSHAFSLLGSMGRVAPRISGKCRAMESTAMHVNT